MIKYCTSVHIDDNIRLDLFTPEVFRVRISNIENKPFPAEYEIPFAVGKTTPWDCVKYTADRDSDSTMVTVRTGQITIHCRKGTGSFIVEMLDGKRLYPEDVIQYGMFKNHCIVFDSASFHKEETNCSRYAHWFYNPTSELYDVNLAEDKLLDTFFIWAKTYKEGYKLFNTLVGAEPMLTKKGYGYYQTQHLASKGTQKLLMKTATLLRERDIPCDTLIVDFEWGDGANDGKEIPWGSSLNWSTEYSKPLSPEQMTAELKKLHYDVMLIHHSIPAYKGRADEDWVCAEYDSDLWWKHINGLLDMGIVGTWQDTRQTDITNSRIYSGMQKHLGKDRRCSFLGSYDIYRDSCWTKDCVMIPIKQRIGGRRTPFYWTGDMSVKTWTDLEYQVKAIVNEHGALKGVSYITNDCMRPGGQELAVRSNQFLCFNSVTRSHNCKPWESPENSDALGKIMAIQKDNATAETNQQNDDDLLGLNNIDEVQEKSIRKFLKLRYRLLPYIYTLAREAYDTGLPLTRPLMVEFEKDINCNLNQYPLEYAFGRNLLVCPVYSNSDKMNVYLPIGCDWVDFWTGEKLAEGKKISVDTNDLSKMPLFVRSGAILPMVEERNYIDGNSETLYLNIYGDGADTFELYEDDGKSLGYQSGEYSFTKIISEVNDTRISLSIEPRQGTYPGVMEKKRISACWKGNSISARKKFLIANATAIVNVYEKDGFLNAEFEVDCKKHFVLDLHISEIK